MNHRTTRLTVATESHCTKKTEVKPRNIQTEKNTEDSDCGATDRSGLSESLYMDRNVRKRTVGHITKKRLFKYIENFTTKK